MKTIIAGSRWIELTVDEIDEIVQQCDWQPTEVVSGTARGIDRSGESWAQAKGIPIKRFSAKWNEHGKIAGFIRNEEMAEYADALIAVWDGESRGTKHMIQAARNHGLRVRIVERVE